MNKKYELTDETIMVNRRVLHRIKALRTFGFGVESGDLGGFIESEDNLDHAGRCWVFDVARVYETARISENARVRGYSQVFGNARVYQCAQIFVCAHIFGEARVYGNAEVYGHAKVFGNSMICGYGWINDWAEVYGTACVSGNAQVLRGVKLDSGCWNTTQQIDCRQYIISTTLKKILISTTEEDLWRKTYE